MLDTVSLVPGPSMPTTSLPHSGVKSICACLQWLLTVFSA